MTLLQEIVPNQIWCAEHAVNFGPLSISTRATLVKLSDDTLWVHSPIPASDEIQQAIAKLGPVAYIVSPNRMHYLYFREFIGAYPNATGFIAQGLGDKEPSLSKFKVLDDKTGMLWEKDFDSLFIQGLPVLNETVWFHRASGTLIITDLLFCFGSTKRFINRLVASFLGVYNRVGMSRTMKLMVKDKKAFRASISQIESWDVKRIILAHDQIIEHDIKHILEDAFAWLKS